MSKRRLTSAEYAEMAADYAANPPAVDELLAVEINPAVLRIGRPARDAATSGKTPGLTVRLPDTLRAELTRRAGIEGSSASELIRQAVVEFFANHPAPAT